MSIVRKHSNKVSGLWRVTLFEKFPKQPNKINGKQLGRSKKKVLPLAVAAETMPLDLAVTSRPKPGPSTGLGAVVQCIFRNMFSMV